MACFTGTCKVMKHPIPTEFNPSWPWTSILWSLNDLTLRVWNPWSSNCTPLCLNQEVDSQREISKSIKQRHTIDCTKIYLNMQLINPLHILCFGDSITAGWYWTGPEWHPYAYSLVESLTKSYPSLSVDADVQGLGGDRVISPPGVYFPRMTQLCKHLYVNI